MAAGIIIEGKVANMEDEQELVTGMIFHSHGKGSDTQALACGTSVTHPWEYLSWDLVLRLLFAYHCASLELRNVLVH